MSCLPGNWHCAKKFLLLRTSFEVRSFLCVQWCRLKQMTYANGDKMFAKYNSIGQMVDEKWQNSTGTDIAHYKYVYDGKGNIVRSIDFLGKKEYNYEYEDGRIVRATESNITVTNEIVTSKVIVNTIKYYLADRFVFKHKAGPVTYLWGIKAGLSGAIIVLYQHKGWNSSLHYVAGIKTGGGVGGSFRFYNDKYYKNKYGTTSISVWKYIDLLKENGCKPLLFWGVALKSGWW